MRALVQRVTSAHVRVGSEVVGDLPDGGLVALIGVTHTDTVVQAQALANKIAHLRIMAGERSVLDTGAGVLVVSQFTLYGSTERGRRPSWTAAAPRPVAEPLIQSLDAHLQSLGVPTQGGRFGADMQVSLVNDGPVTLMLEIEAQSGL